MHVVFGPDRRASLGIPRNATHLRLTCAQAVRVDAGWPGRNPAVQPFSLSGNAGGRQDFAVAGNATGQVILTREAGSQAEVYATWIVSA